MTSLTRRRWLSLAAAAPAGLRAQPATKPGGYSLLSWEDLVPKGWDPMKGLQAPGLAAINDGDPAAADMMRRLREAWDNAPAETRLDGTAIKLPGYLVPLDESRTGLTEFLLVPYFGACIHTPPPPANQIVLVQPSQPLQGYHAMDTVWVSGRLRAARQGSPMGTAAYRLEAALVERYTTPPQR